MKKLNLIKESTDKSYNGSAVYKVYEISGYEVTVEHFEFANGAVCDNVYVEKNYLDKYLPEIYFHSLANNGKGEFKIQTTGYGTMTPAEIKQMIAKYEEAIDVVETLTKTFC